MFKIDISANNSNVKPLEGRQTISFLLGSGFSVPKGYPVGNAVNEQLSHFKFENYGISSAGEIYRCKKKILTHSSQYQRNMVFCERIISEYTKNQHEDFDYEMFFDFIHGEEILIEPYKNCAEGLIGKFEKYTDFVFGLENIFTQMITEVIKDKNRKIWYDNEPNTIGDVDDYDTLLKVINAWSDDYIVDIHTLNHDMLFESFKRRDYIAGKICDGFSEFGSEYYGELKTCEGRKYNVRLERYTGKYSTPVRLYKLHGSFDYVLYYNSKGVMMSPDNCIKTRFDVDLKSLKKEVIFKNEYERFPFAYHGYFLTGIKTKVNPL